MVDNIPSVEDPIVGLAQTIPYNFYNIIILIMVFLFASGKLKDYGPMKQAEKRAQEMRHYHQDDFSNEVAATKEESNTKSGSVSDMLVPLGISVFILVILGLWNYTLPMFTEVPTLKFGGNMMLIISFSIGIIIAFFKYTKKNLMSAKEFSDDLFEGAKSVIFGAVIIILAVTIGDLMRAAAPEGTGAALYIEQVAQGVIPNAIIPVSVFLISAFVSFSIGTSFGTWAIMMPIAVSLMLATGGDPILAAAAVLSGGAFGDHSSPISDTSLMSSIGADVKHMDHINTQLPYALTSAGIAAVCFLIAGFII
nr:Na+/H+ antiporter NhaC family protein [Thalassobacillus pellis]